MSGAWGEGMDLGWGFAGGTAAMSVDAGAAGAGPGIGLSGFIGGAFSSGGGMLCSGTVGMLVFGFLGAESMTDFLGVSSPTATKGAVSSVLASGLMSGL